MNSQEIQNGFLLIGLNLDRQVQRSVDDQSILVATYEGEHNHPNPSQMEATSGAARCVSMTPAALTAAAGGSSSAAAVSLDLAKPKSSTEGKTTSSPRFESPELQQFLVEQMASSLTKDPNFTAALAAAISGKIFPH